MRNVFIRCFLGLILLAPFSLLHSQEIKNHPFLGEISNFRKQDSLNPPAPGNILFIGSSSFTIWKDVQDYFPNSTIINRGFGGSTLPDLNFYFNDILPKYKPRQIVMYCGENDLASSDTVTAIMVKQRFADLFKKIRSIYPKVPFVYVSIKPSPSRWHLHDKAIAANAAIRSFLAKQKNTTWVNVWDQMLNAEGKPDETLFGPDMLHMNAKGYTIWQKLIEPVLTRDKKFQTNEEATIFNEVQKASFQYFWEGAEPMSGLGRERYHQDNIYPENDKSTVTSGGAGFGVMAILAAIENKFITRDQGRERLEKIVHFLETADRFHGAWPHWWNGETGKVRPFSKKDNGGDLVETSYMIQGLLCARQYFKDGNEKEKALAARMDVLWKQVEFDWYRNGKNVLYWHWSPDYKWEMNFPVVGYNECLIMYVLAASSPTHGVPANVYHEGWADNGKINKDPSGYDGIQLRMSHQGKSKLTGPLFWAQYSYLGLDPHGLKDMYADYWHETKGQTLINYKWCVNNPNRYKGYGPDSWGLTSSYSINGYAGHAPGKDRDLGVISPTAALSSFPYTPGESMAAMLNWYKNKKDKLWGPFGFYDAFSETANWYIPRYLAIDQGPIVVMMENYRSGLLWKLFMSCPEIQQGLKKLGFSSPYFK